MNTGRGEENGELMIITINIPKKFNKMIKKLIDFGLYVSRSEFARNAIQQALKEQFKLIENTTNFITLDKFDRSKVIIDGKKIKLIKEA